MNPSPPYLCLSALESSSEVEGALRSFSQHADLSINQQPCIGFAVDERLFSTGSTNASRKVQTLDLLRECLAHVASKKVLAALHFDMRNRDKGALPTGSVQELADCFDASTQSLIDFCQRHVSDGVLLQLNGVVLPGALRRLRSSLPLAPLIYAIKPGLYRIPVSERRAHLNEVAPLVDYVLVDASAGQGLPFSVEHVKEVNELLRPLARPPTLGVAGGLSARTIAPRIKELSGFLDPGVVSLDVESGIRDTEGRVSVRLVDEFLAAAYRALKEFTITPNSP